MKIIIIKELKRKGKEPEKLNQRIMISQQAIQTLDHHAAKFAIHGELIDRIRVTYKER